MTEQDEAAFQHWKARWCKDLPCNDWSARNEWDLHHRPYTPEDGMSNIIIVDGEPIPKGRPRTVTGTTKAGKKFTRTYTPQRTKDAEAHIQWAAKSAHPGLDPIPMPREIGVAIHFASRKKLASTYAPDLDNLAKTVKDALNGIIWEDDCQVQALMLTIEREAEIPETVIMWELL